jgi:hypothetical protein
MHWLKDGGEVTNREQYIIEPRVNQKENRAGNAATSNESASNDAHHSPEDLVTMM